ncbi:MAG: hypothetical protein KDK91_18480 [Gammaproteobacteria bacterium]|nr:hypothetical protein [Gammaproteobacteria bacterium]
MKRRSLLNACTLALASLSSACVYVPADSGPGPYRPDYYDYYFYPDVGVYFHLYSGYYYYRDGHSWLRARVLPPGIHLDHRVRRLLVIHDDPPYRRHETYRREYRPDPRFRPEPRHDGPERAHNRRTHDDYRRRR